VAVVTVALTMMSSAIRMVFFIIYILEICN